MTLRLQDVVSGLYEVAVSEGKATSTIRLRALGAYCLQELSRRGLAGSELEASVPGAGRDKKWDVAWFHHGRPRLAISLKSVLKNLAGATPNRIDDLIGEAANAQLASPEIVLGYVVLIDLGQDTVSAKHGRPWRDVFRERLLRLSGRTPPHWTTGTLEAIALVEVDFTSSARLFTPERELADFFDTLALQVRLRNPDLPPVPPPEP